MSKADSLLVDFNLNNYKTNPLRIRWDIDISEKYDYKSLKDTAKRLYEIKNHAESPEEKIKVKIASAAYILRGFETLKQKLAAKHDEFTNRHEVKSLLEKDDPLLEELNDNLNMITQKYIDRVEAIQKEWYEDWKNFGEIEDYTPLSAQMYGVSMQERHRILEEAGAKYDLLYNHNEGADESNPIKWWITNIIKPKLEIYAKKQPDEWGDAPNADEYSDGIVKQTLQKYLDEINTLSDNNLIQAYNHINKILNYLNRFADIDSSISFERPLRFDERIQTIKVRNGYSAETQKVKNIIFQIYNEMYNKYNSSDLTDFVEFMYYTKYENQNKPNYFSNFNSTTDILFELYFVRKNNITNYNNFSINNIADMYRMWKENGKRLDYYLPEVKISWGTVLEPSRWVYGKYENVLHHFARADGSENVVAQVGTWYNNKKLEREREERKKEKEKKDEKPEDTKPPPRSVLKRQNKKK